MYFTSALLIAKPRTQRIESLVSLVKIFTGSLLMVLSAQWVIPLQPVPITLQTLMVMLLGVFLGRREGSYSVMLYLFYIAMGFPAAAGGLVNPLVLIGPKAGYYVGMVLQAYLVGCYAKNSSGLSQFQTLGMFALISLGQLTLGAVVLGAFLGAQVAFYAGFLPFVAGEIIKCAIAMRALSFKA